MVLPRGPDLMGHVPAVQRSNVQADSSAARKYKRAVSEDHLSAVAIFSAKCTIESQLLVQWRRCILCHISTKSTNSPFLETLMLLFING